jgi:hypothetical protein
MSGQLYLTCVVAGSGWVGLWLCVRLRLAAKRALSAAGCFAAAWVIPGLAGPLLHFWLGRAPLGLAILAAVFPVLTATFACACAGLRYLVDRLGHATS